MIESPSAVGAGDLVLDRFSWRPHGRHDPTLREITLRLRAGERILVVGASGSGKSTLLLALAGLLDESLGEQTGAVRLGGEDPQAEAGAIGLLLQDPTHSLVADYAGRDTAFGPENRGQPRAEIIDRAADSLARVGFPYGADHSSVALSGGEMQRLALAGALALGPSWLLLDEPTAMLDATSAAQVRDAVVDVVEDHDLGLIVVEHRIEGWLDCCDRLIVLAEDGSVLADGPLQATLADRATDLIAAGVWVPGAPTPEVQDMNWPAIASSHPGGHALSITGLDLASPDSSRLLVGDLNAHLERGGELAVVGPSGSGKSTLLRTVAGMRSPTNGKIEIGGRAAADGRPVAAQLGWVPQHSEQIITRSTVWEEVLATSRILYADHPDRMVAAEERAKAVLAGLGLSRLVQADPYQLSGGEQRRVALATAVVHAPELLLLDEPTVGQDRHTWAAVRSVIGAVRAEGTAVMISSHDETLVGGMDQVVRLGHPSTLRPTPPVERQRTKPDYTVRPVIEPGSPLVARCNPLAMLIIGVGAAVGSFFIRDWLVGLITLVFGLILAPLAVRRIRPALLRLIPVGLASLTVGWSTLLFSRYGWLAAEAVPVAIREVLRICCLVVPGALLLGAVRPSSLGDALAQRLHAPHRVVAAATSALLRLDQLREQWQSLAEVRRIRGLAPGRSPVARVRFLASMTVALLVWMLRSAQQMAISMDARGFAGATRRTFALGSPWRGRDWACCAVAVVFLVLPIMLTRWL